MQRRKTKYALGYLSIVFLITFFATGCMKQQPKYALQKHLPEKEMIKMQVYSTAYTSRLKRKNAKYPVGAWGDALTPSCRCIAVSADLIKMGLIYESKVRIDELEGEYTVMDKMHPKWRKKIDIYMGDDFKRAKYWGNRTVTIRWEQSQEKNTR